MNLYTYHGFKSSGVGGIETLYRSLHSLALLRDWSVTEIYSKETKDYFKIDPRIQLKKIPAKLFNFPVWGIFLQSLYLSIYFLLKKDLNNSLFLCVDIRLLYFFPKNILSKTKVVVIQSNRLDLTYGKVATNVLRKKYKYINFTVYTDIDKEKLLDMFEFLNENSIHTIPRGCKLTTALKEKNIRTIRYNLVTIARIAKQKNLAEMLAIINMLPKEYKLFVYGDGDEEEVNEFKTLIKGNTSVVYKGPAIDLYEALSDKSLFLMTSSYEGYGQTLIEARSQGLPIIVYDTFDALKTIVDDGKNGFIVQPYNSEMFSKSIINITTNLDTYEKMSKISILKAKDTELEKINYKWVLLFTFLSGESK